MSVFEYVRVAAVTPNIRVADCDYNTSQILETIKRAQERDVNLLCMPELCITGYTCADLFLQANLLAKARSSLTQIIENTADSSIMCVVGVPILFEQKLYNVAAVIFKGKLLALIPKTYVPNYSEFYELRHFSPAFEGVRFLNFNGSDVPIGTNIIISCIDDERFRLGFEICEDLWTTCPPSVFHAKAGATIIVNIAASNETVGKADYRRKLVVGQSARLIGGYVYASAGHGESTTDMVFSGHNLVCENGEILDESLPFERGWAESEVDLHALSYDRTRMNSFPKDHQHYTIVHFDMKIGLSKLNRKIDASPFIPSGETEKFQRCAEIINIQSFALMKRLEHMGCTKVVIGLSGGLDSCLATIVVHETFKKLRISTSNILTISMPCFGTSGRTRYNAQSLSGALKTSFEEIDVTDLVKLHLAGIKHTENQRDIVYENAQARIRTLVLMDLANKHKGIVIGTGDLSELALGWTTYCGDHMSMYGINAGLPKTLVRHVVCCYAQKANDSVLSAVLQDILETPISPELIPDTEKREIVQKTEEIIGDYQLHDFFIYHCIRWGRSPLQIYNLSVQAFGDLYAKSDILKWLKEFYERFFANQFKRNCLPDGPKIGFVCLSPRSDWRMPSDASKLLWKNELESI